MRNRVDRPLHDRHRLCDRFCDVREGTLVGTSDANSCNRFWECNGPGAVYDHATCVRTWIRCGKDVKSNAGKDSQPDESYGIWHRSLPVRIAGQPAAMVERVAAQRDMVLADVHTFWPVVAIISFEVQPPPADPFPCGSDKSTPLIVNYTRGLRENLCRHSDLIALEFSQ